MDWVNKPNFMATTNFIGGVDMFSFGIPIYIYDIHKICGILGYYMTLYGFSINFRNYRNTIVFYNI